MENDVIKEPIKSKLFVDEKPMISFIPCSPQKSPKDVQPKELLFLIEWMAHEHTWEKVLVP